MVGDLNDHALICADDGDRIALISLNQPCAKPWGRLPPIGHLIPSGLDELDQFRIGLAVPDKPREEMLIRGLLEDVLESGAHPPALPCRGTLLQSYR